MVGWTICRPVEAPCRRLMASFWSLRRSAAAAAPPPNGALLFAGRLRWLPGDSHQQVLVKIISQRESPSNTTSCSGPTAAAAAAAGPLLPADRFELTERHIYIQPAECGRADRFERRATARRRRRFMEIDRWHWIHSFFYALCNLRTTMRQMKWPVRVCVRARSPLCWPPICTHSSGQWKIYWSPSNSHSSLPRPANCRLFIFAHWRSPPPPPPPLEASPGELARPLPVPDVSLSSGPPVPKANNELAKRPRGTGSGREEGARCAHIATISHGCLRMRARLASSGGLFRVRFSGCSEPG